MIYNNAGFFIYVWVWGWVGLGWSYLEGVVPVECDARFEVTVPSPPTWPASQHLLAEVRLVPGARRLSGKYFMNVSHAI